MSFLREYVFSLCTLMVIFSAVFTALPEGATKSTVKSVIGIVTALALISPLFAYEEKLLLFEFSKGEELVDYHRAEQMEKKTLRTLEISAEEQIKSLLGREGEVRVVLSAEGITEKVEIENVTENERDFISRKTGIDKERITKP